MCLQRGDGISHYQNQDLWEAIAAALRVKDSGRLRVRRVPSHTDAKAVDAGVLTATEQALNRGADELAVRGAALHAVPPQLALRTRRLATQAAVVHGMLARVLVERAAALPDLLEEASEEDGPLDGEDWDLDGPLP